MEQWATNLNRDALSRVANMIAGPSITRGSGGMPYMYAQIKRFLVIW